MATQHMFLFDPPQDARTKKLDTAVRLSGNAQNDVFLSALLEMPTTKRTRRNPLEWAGAMGLHIVVLVALIIVPLYTTGTIQLNKYEEIPLVAPPLPPAPPPPPAGSSAAPHITHPKAKLNYTFERMTVPTAIPKKIFSGSDNVAQSAPDLGVQGGVPGGVPGGVIGGVMDGVIGGTGPSAPPAPPSPVKAAPKVVRVGGNIRAPRQTYSVQPIYPGLARATHIWGTVVVDAVIDQQGNVVQARVLSGHPLLIDEALKAVLQWKYEPTTLNGQPVSVELQVQVHFSLSSQDR